MNSFEEEPRLYRPGYQRVEGLVVPLTITSNNLFIEFLLSIPATLSSADLKVMIPNRGMLPPWDTTLISLISKLRLPPAHLEPLMSLDQQAKEGVTR